MSRFNRYPVKEPVDGGAHVQGVRGFPRSYEVAPTGACYGLEPSTGWARGEIERGLTPSFMPPPPIPMYDPTIMADPNEWGPRNLT